jgi:hypothetical protein
MSTIAQQLQPLWEHNLELIPSRKVRVQKVGSHYKAFFEGDGCNVTFGTTPSEATKRLKFWEKFGKA